MMSVHGFIITQLALVLIGAGAGAVVGKKSAAKGASSHAAKGTAGIQVKDKTTVDGTAFEVSSRGGGPSVEVQGEPIFNSKKSAFFSAKDDFESNHPQTEAKLFDCSNAARCVEVWHAATGEGSRDVKWIDNDRLQLTIVRDVDGEYVAKVWTCSVKSKSCMEKR